MAKFFGNGKNDRNKGLSEEQRLQKSFIEKRILESKQRLSDNLENFRQEYKQIVLKYGIKFRPGIRVTQEGILPYMFEQECREELDAYKKSQQEKAKQESGIIKPDEGGVIKH